MLPRVTGVRHLKDFRLEISFSDGTVAEVDFRDRIVGRGGVFQSLECAECIPKVAVDPAAGTLVWSNGVDFCPNALYAEATGKTVADLSSDAEVA